MDIISTIKHFFHDKYRKSYYYSQVYLHVSHLLTFG